MNALYCGSGWHEVVDVLRERLPANISVTIWDRQIPLTEAVRHIEILFPSNAHIDRAVISAASKLLLIQQPASGTDAIDIQAARERGIPVCNAPGNNHVSVAEAALLFMLALARRLPEATRAFARAKIGGPSGFELAGKTLGIIGMGLCGRALAERARALGMHVLGTRSSSTAAELDELLATADIVSLHCPLTPATRGLIDARALARMKPGAMLINCARGPVIDRPALIDALDRGHLGGVGLDTFWEEPWDPTDPLFQRPNVVALPHVAGSTRESFANIADVAAGNVRRLLAGEPLRNRIA